MAIPIAAALQVPLVRKAAKTFGIGIGALALAGGAYWAFDTWRDNLIEAADAAGYERSVDERREVIREKNKKIAQLQGRVNQMNTAFGIQAAAKTQAVTIKLEPIKESIREEVSQDPVYQRCVVTDGVLDNLNAGRSSINEALDPATAGVDRPGPKAPPAARAGFNG